MGCCCSFLFCEKNVEIKAFAIKFPHGKTYQSFHSSKKSWEVKEDINSWIRDNLFGCSREKKWTHGLVYNDQPPDTLNKHETKGHCKGILCWNATRIGWLCHSVPRFPFAFTESFISDIEPAEYIYGQSFQYIEFPFDTFLLNQIMGQITLMEVHVYITFPSSLLYPHQHHNQNVTTRTNNTCNEIQLTPTIRHIAKPPHWKHDIYSHYLVLHYPFSWKVESWIRSHRIPTSQEVAVQDVETWKGRNELVVRENQDHSKWAVSDKEYYFIGDLNRMTSQFERGGGGFLCQDPVLSRDLKNMIHSLHRG